MKTVKVNWFQKEIDSPERNWSFIKKQGNLIKFLHNRFQWYNYPRLSQVAEFPLHVDIEVSANCDLTCPMCPRRHADVSEYNHMDFNLFKRIVDECAQYNLFSARLSWRGESLTHPQFLDFVRYIKTEKKIPNVSFLTNGHKLNQEIAIGLVEAGIDYVSFSVDGIDDIYDIVRAPAKFESVYNGIKTLKEIREKVGKPRPQIRIIGLWPAIAKNAEGYFNKMKHVADKIVTNPVKDYRITNETKFAKDYVCQYPWERLFVGCDGRTQPCSNSIERLYIGDVREQTLAQIWKGEVMDKLRKDHIEGRIDRYFACSRCSNRVETDFKGQLEKDWSDWDPSVYTKN